MPEGIQTHVPLHTYTTLHIGGVADYVCEAETIKQLVSACQFAAEAAIPVLILGGGSNVLISDDGFRGMVIITKIKKRECTIKDDEVVLTLGAGEVLDDVVAWTVTEGWWGLENLSAIPGTVGATPVQNVGAYGVEVADFITQVIGVHIRTGETRVFQKCDCQFSYRDSFFKTAEGKQWAITEVTYRLSRVPSPHISYADLIVLQEKKHELTPRIVRNEIIAVRSKKFPDWSVVGTAGSFFKNPIISPEAYASLKERYPLVPAYEQADGRVKVSLGFILDKVCELRGYCEGDVCLFEKQALVLIAHEGATATAVKQFVKNISEIVFEKTNITIECEVQFV